MNMTTLRNNLLTSPLPGHLTEFERASGAVNRSMTQKLWFKDYEDVKVKPSKIPVQETLPPCWA
jgi:hypothetical protein